jgi:choline dehydrogenase
MRQAGNLYDYIIVGAGSAGCVLANRLTEDGTTTVLLLERGGSDNSIFIQMPSALSIPLNMNRYNWGYASEPEPYLGGRRINCPRGKVIGGSSSINGLVYIRGHALDYENWEAQGARGWGYRHVLPYFRHAETSALGADAYRGGEGPLHTQYGTLRNPLYRAFTNAAAQAGYELTEDVNGYQQEGFGRMDMTVHRGRRCSAARAYLKPALRRRNLTIATHAAVSRIEFENRRAVAVHYRHNNENNRVIAGNEIILAGGAINSPQLLKLSGIGPARELQLHGIEIIHDLPGVGENLQDHLEFYYQMACTKPITLYSAMNPFAKALIGLRWLLRHDGLGATNHFESCGFIRSRVGERYPDIQYHFLPLAVSYDGHGLANEHGMQAHVGPMRSKSRGHVTLASPDPERPPRILFNYMSHPDDWRDMRACLRLTREIFAQPALSHYCGREIQPGADITTDDEIDQFVREKVESAYHPCGTCKMGDPDDPQAVVAPDTRVIGIEGLRVVDASIMPSITNGNLNAPTIMLAEKAADIILGRPPLAPSNAPFHIAENWQISQR